MTKKTCISKNQQVQESELTSRNANISNPNLAQDVQAVEEEYSIEDLERLFAKPGFVTVYISMSNFWYVQKICNHFNDKQSKIMFKFEIGSSNSEVLKFWNPDLPSFEEILESLKLAHSMGFATFVNCAPPLDMNTLDLVNIVSPYVNIIDIHIINRVEDFLTEEALNDPESVNKAEELFQIQSGDWLPNLYEKLKNNSKVRWSNDTLEFLNSKIGDMD